MKSKAVILVVMMMATLALFPGCGKKTPNLNLSGTVIDASSGKPIQGANVSDKSYGPEPRKGGVTDSSGRYSYRTWAEEHTIEVKAPGYKPQTAILSSSQTVLDFKLSRD